MPSTPRPSVFDADARASRPLVTAAMAQAHGSPDVGVHHLLLAATAVPGSVAWTLATRGLDEAVLRDALDRRCGVPHPPSDRRVPIEPVPGSAVVPFSESARAAMVMAVHIARTRGRTLVEPDDPAIAAASSPSTVVADALDELGIVPSTLRRALVGSGDDAQARG